MNKKSSIPNKWFFGALFFIAVALMVLDIFIDIFPNSSEFFPLQILFVIISAIGMQAPEGYFKTLEANDFYNLAMILAILSGTIAASAGIFATSSTSLVDQQIELKTHIAELQPLGGENSDLIDAHNETLKTLEGMVDQRLSFFNLFYKTFMILGTLSIISWAYGSMKPKKTRK